MLISSKQKHNSIFKGQNEDLKLKIRDNELEVVKKTKYLGLQIDCSLDWKEQITAVSAKVSRAIGFLRPRLHDTVFISYRIGFISNWHSVYTIPFSFHIGLASCLHENTPIRYASYRFRVFK